MDYDYTFEVLGIGPLDPVAVSFDRQRDVIRRRLGFLHKQSGHRNGVVVGRD